MMAPHTAPVVHLFFTRAKPRRRCPAPWGFGMDDVWPTVCGWLSVGEAATLRRACHGLRAACPPGFDGGELRWVLALLDRLAGGDAAVARGLARRLLRALAAAPWGLSEAVPRAVWTALHWDDGGRKADWASHLLACDCPRCFETLRCGRGTAPPLTEAEGDYLFHRAWTDLPPWGDGTPWATRRGGARPWGEARRQA